MGCGGVLASDFEQQNPSRPPGPRSCQMARCPRTLPPPLRRPLCPSWRTSVSRRSPRNRALRGHRAWILWELAERRRPGPASAASRSLQKIVGAIVGAASRAGREHLQGSSPPDAPPRERQPSRTRLETGPQELRPVIDGIEEHAQDSELARAGRIEELDFLESGLQCAFTPLAGARRRQR